KELSVFTEAKPRCRVDALIVAVYRILSDQGLLQNPAGTRREGLSFTGMSHTRALGRQITVSFLERRTIWPVIWFSKPRDAAFPRSGPNPHLYGDGTGQQNIKVAEKLDGLGALTDGWVSQFYQLNMEGEWSVLPLQAKKEGWQLQNHQ
ncbi:hypothetical protein N7519_005244, partial [Penicillium mononematosum]|uniref:uncharacterized protein n=1 Tax=Penicillium mononematosum TaxID=268346 RepID=UPI00254766A2